MPETSLLCTPCGHDQRHHTLLPIAGQHCQILGCDCSHAPTVLRIAVTRCPWCKGAGEVIAHHPATGRADVEICGACRGTGIDDSGFDQAVSA